MLHWEIIDDFSARLPVFGGWIVRSQKSIWNTNSAAISLHQVFVSDKNHEWDLEDPLKKSKKAK